MSIEKKGPEIRFKGFCEEWESFLLENISDVVDGDRGHNYPNGEELKEQGHTLFLSASNVTKNGFRFDIRQYITQDKSESLGNGKLIVDDIILTSRGSIGHIAWYNESISREIPFARINSGMLILRVKSKISPGIISLYLKSPKGKKKIETVSFGSAQPQLTKASVSNLSVTIPKKNSEQTQIGSYFQQLDNLIKQHQLKHDKLSNIKTAMLEKMFPKQGETIPEIRFKGFSGAWNEISLLDSIERVIDFRGRTPKKLGLDWSPSGYRALSALNVKQGYIDFSIDPHFGNQELYDKWMSGSELHQGQVLFTTEAPMGNVAQVPNADKYILSQRTIAFIVKSRIITDDFLAVLLRSSKVFRELSALSSGGTAKGVSQKALASFNVFIPTNLVEQSAIGNYSQKLDALINQHQQQITKLNNIKQACLSKMFV
ncbi:hypothetical protein CHI95_16495 [Providencia rettgeri]|uniref:Type I restriction modification DNA specificity domain-containing protein n=1 Tax=Providencia rettgeri TaxID=587 RepID=A0A264VQ59_PRORE|nr:restriction endonuclease subunit S [Providencia rettgeri]OZS73508.1 hypothetical protein CHI95_16495 [Providencia rettgeri]